MPPEKNHVVEKGFKVFLPVQYIQKEKAPVDLKPQDDKDGGQKVTDAAVVEDDSGDEYHDAPIVPFNNTLDDNPISLGCNGHSSGSNM